MDAECTSEAEAVISTVLPWRAIRADEADLYEVLEQVGPA